MAVDKTLSEILDARLGDDAAPIIIGASGGMDSTVLAHATYHGGYAAHLAHVNYQLRPSADEDEAFVRQLAKSFDWPVHVLQADPAALREAKSLQAEARDRRYAFFAEIAAKVGARWVAVAHHRNDQAETVLLQLFRGAGIEGLSGMSVERSLRPDSSVRLIRPLLHVPQSDIETYARTEGLDWQEDPTNALPTYARNTLRLDLMPRIEEEFGPEVTDRIARAADFLGGYWEHSVRPDLERRFAECRVEGEPALATDPLQQQPQVWQGRLVLEALHQWLPDVPIRHAVTEEILELMQAQVGRKVAFDAGTIWRERGKLYFQHCRPAQLDEPQTLSIGEELLIDGRLLSLKHLAHPPDNLRATPPDVAYFDAQALKPPFTVRKWKPGDHIQPLGMQGTKSVSDILTDNKVPSYQRDHVLVLETGGEIVWLIGHRQSEKGKVTPDTGAVLQAEWREE